MIYVRMPHGLEYVVRNTFAGLAAMPKKIYDDVFFTDMFKNVGEEIVFSWFKNGFI